MSLDTETHIQFSHLIATITELEVKYFCHSINILESLMQYMPGIQSKG